MVQKLVHFFIFLFIGLLIFSFLGKILLVVYSRQKVVHEVSRIMGVPVKIKKISATFLPGWFEIDGLEILNPQGYTEEKAFTMKKIWVDLCYLETFFNKAPIIETIIVERPSLEVELKRGRKNNWAELFRTFRQKRKPAGEHQGVNFLVKKIYLKNGLVTFVDEQFARPVIKLVLKNIDLKILKLTNRMPPEEMTTSFSGRAVLEPKAAVKLEGVANFFKNKMDFDASFELAALDLVGFRPYFYRAAVKINQGEVFSRVDLKCRENRLSGRAQIDVKRLTLSRSGGLIDGLVDFLKSTGGVLHLNVPVYGTIMRPRFDVMGAVGEVVAHQAEGAIKSFGRGVEGFFKGLFNVR
jgi:hypothetical protein